MGMSVPIRMPAITRAESEKTQPRGGERLGVCAVTRILGASVGWLLVMVVIIGFGFRCAFVR